jgi:hypothetical protein
LIRIVRQPSVEIDDDGRVPRDGFAPQIEQGQRKLGNELPSAQ